MNFSEHALARLLERKITLSQVAETIKHSKIRYRAHKDSDLIAFEHLGIRAIVDPVTLTVVTVMFTDERRES